MSLDRHEVCREALLAQQQRVADLERQLAGAVRELHSYRGQFIKTLRQLDEARTERDDEQRFIEAIETALGCKNDGSMGSNILADIQRQQVEIARLREMLNLCRTQAFQLTDFMYGAVRECATDMIIGIDAALAAPEPAKGS